MLIIPQRPLSSIARPPLPPGQPSPSHAAFSLVEIVIALGIASFCLVALLGLFPTGLKSAKNTTDQTAAATLLNTIALDLRSTPPGSGNSPLMGIAIGNTNTTNFFLTENGVMTNSSTALAVRYGVLLTQSNSPTTNTTTAQIRVYWPPTLSTNRLGSALGIIESVITINRK
jgi:uncharacterized protein (TIGR02598 family)